MIIKKAGTVLLNLKTKQIDLVYRQSQNDFSFPKGHLEENESLSECAVRETEEETLRANHLLINKEIYVLKYTTPLGENAENYMYISVDDGPTTKNISVKDRETLQWVDVDNVECFLVGNPRSDGHVAISTKTHYKDMMEIPDDLCAEIFVFAKKMMNILKNVYMCESVYLCTMCDGPMNHFHIQLIPRYSFEKRGSKNFVKPRKEYVCDQDKINKIKNLLK